MWKAILLASGLILASATSNAAMPMQKAAPAAAVTNSIAGVETVQYRHDRGNHYGWYKQRRHKGWYKPNRGNWYKHKHYKRGW